MVPARLSAAVVAIALTLVACGSGGTELTDPREILTRTIGATAALRTVTVRAEVQMRGGDDPNAAAGVSGGSMEAQVDFTAMALSARGVGSDGVEAFRLILVDGGAFTGSPNGRWQRSPIPADVLTNPTALLLGGRGFGMPGEAGPDYPSILATAASDPALRVALSGVEDCQADRCYRVTVEIPPEAVWPLLTRLAGFDRMPGPAPEAPPASDMPTITLSVVSDTATMRLVELAGVGSVGASSVQARLQLANPDAPVAINAPPPDLVDQGGDMSIPQPVPAQPVPAQPVPEQPVPEQPAPSLAP